MCIVCLMSSLYSIFNHDKILPLLAVIVEPQVHTISMYMRLGSLYHVLHDLDSGERLFN